MKSEPNGKATFRNCICLCRYGLLCHGLMGRLGQLSSEATESPMASEPVVVVLVLGCDFVRGGITDLETSVKPSVN